MFDLVGAGTIEAGKKRKEEEEEILVENEVLMRVLFPQLAGRKAGRPQELD